ncbi:MAG: endonuclease/exonuclease/phosphatase family protein [Alphaproteobacteria bacterium]|nr:endonuclease/exonuclease/phosphatase family protein [Alphaproteobacteria bacterium]
MNLTIVTWNILAQAYARPERYRGVAPDALDPSRRRARILETVRNLDADLLLLQEVEPDAFEAIGAALPGHRGRYEARRGKPDGLAVFHRPARLTLRRAEPLHYAAVDPGRDHLALLCAFEVDGRPLSVANTHLRWQPEGTPLETHQGVLQMKELLARLQGMPAPWILGGDLNAISQGPVVETAMAAGLRLSARSLRPWDTALINGNRRKLDYLLYNPEQLRPSPRPLPGLSRHHPIPTAEHPSDHLPLYVEFDWR